MPIHSRRVNTLMKRPTRPQMLQTIPRKRVPHAGFSGHCAFLSAAEEISSVFVNGPAMLWQAPTSVEV
jgi:hypothetical protein